MISRTRSTTRRAAARLSLLGLAGAVLALTGCSGSPTSSAPAAGFTPGRIDRTYSGTTISVMTPPWASFPAATLKAFTAKTGITVQPQTLAWDAIHDKVVTAEAAGQSPADVVEMDWTWVSQFGTAGWFTPLDAYLSSATLKDSIGADTFVHGGKRIGVPYNLDFRGTEFNVTMLKKAGITTVPSTTAEVLTAAEAVKKAGITPYPIGLPLKVLEGTSTPWYALVRSAGGQVLDQKGAPAFADGTAGTAALQFIRDAYAKGLIDPGSIGLEDVQVTADFAAAKSAVLLAAGPGQNSQFTDASKSRIAKDQLLFSHVPGATDATGATIGLQEGLAIPANAKNKEAAAMFIGWWLQTPQLVTSYEDPDMGNLPPSRATLQELASQGRLAQSDTILKLVDSVQPVVPGGTPTWYGKFSAAAASTIQSVALGKTTAEAGVTALAKQTEQFAAQAQ